MTDPKEQAAIDCREIFEKHKEEFTRLVAENARPTPAPCDELETVRYEYGFAGCEGWSNRPYLNGENATVTRELVTRQNAEEVIAAKDARIRELEEHFAEMTRSCLAERDRIKALEADNKRLREALEFYADTSKYPAPLTGGMGELWADCGNKARTALGEVKP